MYIVKKLLKLASLLVAISILTFCLLEKSPIDPINAYVGADLTVSQAQKEEIAKHWGLDKSPTERFMASLVLMFFAWTISGILGFLLGIISRINEGKIIDKLIRRYCYILVSTPTFWLGILFIMIFSVKLRLFPVVLGVPIGVLENEVTLSSLAKHLILPAITLQFLSFSELFAGTVFAEQVFSYPGLGQATVQAGIKGDLPLLMGIVLSSVLFIFTGKLVADILYKVVGPRMREGEVK